MGGMTPLLKIIKQWLAGRQDKQRYRHIQSEQEQLMEDIRYAYKEWERAWFCFEHALGEDEVEYAIFSLEAAEKRVGMLLKKAKKANIHALRLGEVL